MIEINLILILSVQELKRPRIEAIEGILAIFLYRSNFAGLENCLVYSRA